MPKKLLACMAILALVGCASQPEPEPETRDIDREPLVEEVTLVEASPSDFLARAQDAENRAQTYQYLLRASDAFFNQNAWQEGAAVLSQLEARELPRALESEYLMQRGRLLIHFEQWQSAENVLDSISETRNREQRTRLIELYYQVYAGQERHLSAARQLVELSLYEREQDYNDAIWYHFGRVPAGYWRQSVRDSGDLMRGWTSLFSRITQALDHREPVSDALNRWQLQFPDHPANVRVQTLLDDSPWVSQQPRRMAVLLPLTGQFAQQGQAIRDGVLAALSNERDEDVIFIDTSRYGPDEVLERLQNESIEAVIGPLSRDYVDRMARTITAQELTLPWVHLWLNRAPEDYTPGLDNFFALDIDTEVESAVSYLSNLGHEQVLVLGTDTQRGRQLATQFETLWQQRHGPRTARTGSYRGSNDMPDVVAQSLHVRDSNQRIESVERAAGSISIESEPRSRRDVTATYLLGDAAQARLLKPFIETNISPFATRMPVFATSSIHESAGNRGRGDLDGIIFSDAPWLYPSHPQADLLARFQDLRPGIPPSSRRLVAMGYDAMELLPRMSTMNWFPGYDHKGLTGQLRILNNAVQRELSWAMFENNTLQERPSHDHTYDRHSL